MGCIQPRDKLSIEESSIVSMESQLEYYKNSSALIDSVHRKYSSSASINLEQWNDIREYLQICTKNTMTCKQIESFFESFENNKTLPLTKMSLLGILMGHGIPRQKARLVFELFDPDCKGSLSSQNVEELLGFMFEICVERLVKLANVNTEKYLNSLETGYQTNKENLTSALLGQSDSVTKQKFISCIEKEYPHILNPHGFRKFCIGG